jgi:hypothetical protein
LERTKLAKVIESRGLKILRNIQTQWISLLAPSKRLVSGYKYIVMKMSEDFPIIHIVATDYELFCDVETMM